MATNSSFYGGRRGASFVIVKNYLDIPSMTEDFKEGNSFKDVAFDEYVMINNPRKNHPDNGKIFRRGYDYNSNRKIEAYVLLKEGQIVYNATQNNYETLKCLKDYCSNIYYIIEFKKNFFAFCSYNEILIFILDYCLLAQTQSYDVVWGLWVAILPGRC